MKKSYDYFKTLKFLSESVYVIYEKVLLKQDFSSDIIQLLAEKSELINNLQNEFITPLERGDIFFLAESLTDQLNSIFSFSEYYNLISHNRTFPFENTNKALQTQSIIISQLAGFKSNLKLFEQCSEEVKKLNIEKKNIEKLIVNALKCKDEQPLVRYAVYSAYLELNRSIYKTILEVEKILINNS